MSVLLVTGGSRGIGAAICCKAANEGWAVAVNYNSSATEAEKIVQKIRSNGGTAISSKADISNPFFIQAGMQYVCSILAYTTCPCPFMNRSMHET